MPFSLHCTTQDHDAQINALLKKNIETIHQIHKCHHMLKQRQMKELIRERERWTQHEDELLQLAVHHFGNTSYKKIQRMLVSKSTKQIYFRLRYLQKNC
ncbi:SANT/Myb_domain [Hexamita inflata]|uniref:SANT/Myb domain n=1 Tax=Hexamita inflata TaxID=28002 RepID=A0AA86QZN7_9EUKA|nr:SANT/Myb domain [Hexamita inflata]